MAGRIRSGRVPAATQPCLSIAVATPHRRRRVKTSGVSELQAAARPAGPRPTPAFFPFVFFTSVTSNKGVVHHEGNHLLPVSEAPRYAAQTVLQQTCIRPPEATRTACSRRANQRPRRGRCGSLATTAPRATDGVAHLHPCGSTKLAGIGSICMRIHNLFVSHSSTTSQSRPTRPRGDMVKRGDASASGVARGRLASLAERAKGGCRGDSTRWEKREDAKCQWTGDGAC